MFRGGILIEVRKEEVPLNPNSEGEVDMVDFGIGVLQGIREIRKRQRQGEINSSTFIYISEDLNEIVEGTIQLLLAPFLDI